jgi:hypothetical protein
MSKAAHTLEEFLAADTDVRFRWVRRGEVDSRELRRYFGDDGFDRYAELAAGVSDHLSGPLTNLIFVPGVMGSLLHNEALGGVWWLDGAHPQRIAGLRLSADGASDFTAGHEIRPFSVHAIYDPFRRAILADDRFRHRAYPYDWRKSIRRSSAGLRKLIEDVYAENGGHPVHLATHSMGGLIVRAMLTWDADGELWSKIGRIVFVATPHFGSPAIAGYLKNHLWGLESLAALGVFLTRETFRSMWGVLGLLPAPRDIYPSPDLSTVDQNPLHYAHPCVNFDLYRASEWRLGLSAEDEQQLQTILDHAAETHRALTAAHRAMRNRYDRMLSIAGAGYRSLFRLENSDGAFSWRASRREFGRIAGHPHRDGDGRVPLASSQLPGVRTLYVRGAHDTLFDLLAVQTTILDWLAGEDESPLAETVDGIYASAHLAADSPVQFADDDPGWWKEDTDAVAVADLLARIHQGHAPEFTRVRIL